MKNYDIPELLIYFFFPVYYFLPYIFYLLEEFSLWNSNVGTEDSVRDYVRDPGMILWPHRPEWKMRGGRHDYHKKLSWWAQNMAAATKRKPLAIPMDTKRLHCCYCFQKERKGVRDEVLGLRWRNKTFPLFWAILRFLPLFSCFRLVLVLFHSACIFNYRKCYLCCLLQSVICFFSGWLLVVNCGQNVCEYVCGCVRQRDRKKERVRDRRKLRQTTVKSN